MILSTITPFLPSSLLYLKVSILNQGNKSCSLEKSNFCLISQK
ncbi:MAG TPA: hypothetical protein PLP75_13680 [Burkholderiales bacterium]|nr:hypothetical protein [Burkholderiales bacterium]